jgi:hypothetical protein
MNNLEKKLMVIRMRTSLDEINRAYLKYYNNPDTLVKVKSEPTQELINRASSGKIDNPILVNSQIKIKEEPIDEYLSIQHQQPITNKISINERKKLASKNWYEKNKERHKAKVKENDSNQSTTRKRYIRELNNKVLYFDKMKPETITKYNIQYDKNKDLYY